MADHGHKLNTFQKSIFNHVFAHVLSIYLEFIVYNSNVTLINGDVHNQNAYGRLSFK